MFIDENYGRFYDSLSLAEEYLRGGDIDAAVGLAKIAARFAYPGKGLFASPKLENLLLKIGKQINSGIKKTEPKNREKPRKVLHILTHARPIGGDSRFVWRWIQRDSESQHFVAITTQADVNGIFEMPKDLLSAVNDSGGFLRVLKTLRRNPIKQALELRLLCQQMDVVALHLFPYDIIPVLALASGCDTVKVLYVNHSDHTFWIGSSVADWIVHLRRQSAEFLRDRRGLEIEHSSILPIPVVYSPRKISKKEAKRLLGYDRDATILLTIASPFKYTSSIKTTFLDLVVPVVKKFPKTILIAVGPDPTGPWKVAIRETNNRIVALGTKWENDLLYAGADIYLDSVPFSSITSLLEAGSYGIPLLGYQMPSSELELLGPGTPGLDNGMELADNIESYRIRLSQLINDRKERIRKGKKIQKNIFNYHTESNWINNLKVVYNELENSDHKKCLKAKNDNYKNCELSLALDYLYSRQAFSNRRLIRDSIVALPYIERLTLTRKLFHMGYELCYLNMLPPPADRYVHWVGKKIKTILRNLWRI